MLRVGTKRRELLARTIADFTKAIFAVAVASQFFKEFLPALRWLLAGMIIVGVIVALILQPEETKEGKRDD